MMANANQVMLPARFRHEFSSISITKSIKNTNRQIISQR